MKRIVAIVIITYALCLIVNANNFSAFFKNPLSKALSGKAGRKYWDRTPRSIGWFFSNKGNFEEYVYNYKNSRVFCDYGDIVYERPFRFKVQSDIISIIGYNNYCFKVIKLTDDSLIVKDLSPIPYIEQDDVNGLIVFVASEDQKSKIENGPLLSPDSTSWQIKVQFKDSVRRK